VKKLEKKKIVRNPFGRPRTPDYRKKMHRFSRFEDAALEIIKKFESEKDKKLVLQMLEEIRG
jgi:hypothetical protein